MNPVARLKVTFGVASSFDPGSLLSRRITLSALRPLRAEGRRERRPRALVLRQDLRSWSNLRTTNQTLPAPARTRPAQLEYCALQIKYFQPPGPVLVHLLRKAADAAAGASSPTP